MTLELIYPENKHNEMWVDIVSEIENAGEKIIPFALSFCQNDFETFLQRTKDNREGVNIGSFVPATTYFLMDENRNRILGAVNIRHYLNEELLFRGGHIGYGVRPSERRKGYAAEMLRQALGICREMGLQKVLVTCDKGNMGSARTIMKNGGIFENEVSETSGNIIQRYWIDLL